MRILMITDDTLIDRRILLEAESLVSQGHELILLSSWAEGLPAHEKIGNVKVERTITNSSSSLCRIILIFTSIAISMINAVSSKVLKGYAVVNLIINYLHTKSIQLLVNNFFAALRLLSKSIYLTINFIFIKGPAFLVNKSYVCLHRLITFLNNRTLTMINSFSSKILKGYAAANSAITYLHTKSIQLLVNNFFAALRLLSKSIYLTINFTFIKGPAFLVNKSYVCLYRLITFLNNRTLTMINSFSSKILKGYAAANSAITYLHTKSIQLLVNNFFAALRLLSKSIYLTINFTFIKGPAFLVNKSCQFLYKYASKISNQDKAFKDRAAYFNPDIVHVHDLPRLRAGCLIKKALNIPLIYDAHELYPEIDTLTNKQKKKLKRLESKFIKQCDSVITVNEFIAEIMERDYKISKINVIYNATNPLPTKLEKQPDLFRQNLPIPSNAHILLFQGWMSKTRGLQNLVRSIPQVEKKIHLVLMGYGDVQDELREIIAQLRIEDRVHILEAVPQTELLKWTSSADAGIIPYQPIDLNNYYCSPNKLFEFIQAGLPIIANALPFLKKVVQENDFGLVADLKSPFEYAKAINLMFKNTNNFNRFKANLKKRSAEFSWASEEVKLKNIYQPTFTLK